MLLQLLIWCVHQTIGAHIILSSGLYALPSHVAPVAWEFSPSSDVYVIVNVLGLLLGSISKSSRKS